jgi:hypothetical protein
MTTVLCYVLAVSYTWSTVQLYLGCNGQRCAGLPLAGPAADGTGTNRTASVEMDVPCPCTATARGRGALRHLLGA